MPNGIVRLCIDDTCVELAALTRSGGGTVNPPPHIASAPEIRIHMDINAILTAANPSAEGRIAGLAFIAQQLGDLAQSLRPLDAKQTALLIDASANLVKQIHALSQKTDL